MFAFHNFDSADASIGFDQPLQLAGILTSAELDQIERMCANVTRSNR